MSEQESYEALVGENDRLRHTLFVMVTDRKKMASKLTGVQNLGLQLQKKEQDNKTLLEKNERLEGSLARAENRITQLCLQGGSGSLGAQSAIVTPGVSKKVLEALTRENTKLKQVLEHLTNKGPNGVDLAVENKDLHEIIMALREERDLKGNEVNELKITIGAVQDQNIESLKNQVLRLTALITKVERNLNAKQVFCETVVTENESLKNDLQSLRDERILRVRDMKRELGQTRTQPDIQRILSRVYDQQDGEPEESSTSEEVYRLKEEVKKFRDELQSKRQEIEHLVAELDKTKQELTLAKDVHNAFDEEKARLLQQLHALSNELLAVKRDREDKEEQLNDQQMERELMQNALAGYENDFKIERQEKVKALSDRDQASRERDQLVQRYEQLKQEHIGLRQNIERMYSQAQQQAQASTLRRQASGRPCAAQVQEPWQQQQQIMRPRGGFPMEACADGPAQDITDSPTTPPKEMPPPPPPQSRRYASQGSQLQCPNCRKLFPHDLLENHMRDCTGDD